MCGFSGPCYDCRIFVQIMPSEDLIMLGSGPLILQLGFFGLGTNDRMRTRTPKSARRTGVLLKVHQPQMIVFSGKGLN